MIRLYIDPSTFSELQRLIAQFARVETELRDRRQAHEEMKDYQTQRWTDNYSGEGSIYGGWAALASSTLADRKRLGFGPGPILMRAGGTFSSFGSQNEAGRVGADYTDWVFRNQPPNYPVTFDQGISSSAVPNQPVRKLWDINGEDEARLVEIMDDYVDSVLAQLM